MVDTTGGPSALEMIPDELKGLRQWVCYRIEERDGKPTKIPYRTDKVGRGNAKSNDPSTWHTFDEVVEAVGKPKNRFDGIGFILSESDPYVFIDLDRVVSESGDIEPWAGDLIERVDSYTELSQSGSGIHIIARAKKPGPRCRTHERPQFEIYDNVRLVVFTGKLLPGAPTGIRDAQDAVNGIYREIFGDNPKNAPARESTKNAKPVGMSDPVLIKKALSAQNGEKFGRLWNGNIGEYNGDPSAADMALCCILAYWTDRDPDRMDRLFRESGLMRDKWDELRGTQTYGQITIDAAIGLTRESYGDHVTTGRKNRTARGSRPAPAPPAARSESTDGLPTIRADCQVLADVTARCWEAIELANRPPRYFLYGGLPSRLERDENGLLVPRELTVDRMRYELARAAQWVAGEDEEPAKPPIDVVRDALATPNPPLPILTRITDVPVYARDGSLQTAPGYHAAGQAYLAPRPGLVIPEVPERPSPGDVAAARDLILHMISEFNFVDQADRAHAVGALVLPFVRDLIDGPTPNHLLEAPSPGSGKGLLAKVLLYPSCGTQLSSVPEAKDDDEWRKRLTAQFRGARPAIWLDNITRSLNSGALASALTATVWEDRILGRSENQYFPVRCAWVTTANNPTMTTEIARRCVRVRLDPKTDRPWQREGFKQPELEKWAIEHRGELVGAALTLAQSWVAAGMPRAAVKPLGSYESWSTVIGGILTHAGIPGFLSNIMEFYEQADVEGAAWRQFVLAWWERFGPEKVGVTELFELASTQDTLDLGKGNERSQRIIFGKRIGSQRDRVVGNHRITRAGEQKGSSLWMLVPMGASTIHCDALPGNSDHIAGGLDDDGLPDYVEI